MAVIFFSGSGSGSGSGVLSTLPAWVTLTLMFFAEHTKVTVAFLADLDSLAVALSITLPLPLPESGLTLSQSVAPLTVQLVLEVTTTETAPPAASKLASVLSRDISGATSGFLSQAASAKTAAAMMSKYFFICLCVD